MAPTGTDPKVGSTRLRRTDRQLSRVEVATLTRPASTLVLQSPNVSRPRRGSVQSPRTMSVSTLCRKRSGTVRASFDVTHDRIVQIRSDSFGDKEGTVTERGAPRNANASGIAGYLSVSTSLIGARSP